LFLRVYRSPNNEIKAEIITPLNSYIPIVQENNSCIDEVVESPNECFIENVVESDEEMADWILYPKLKEQSSRPEVESTPEEKVYNCCMCQNVYNDFEVLKQHALEHPQERRRLSNPNSKSFFKSFDCNICSRKFESKHSLKRHQEAYQNLMACAVCGIMITAININCHMKYHDNDLVECSVCHKMYKKVGLVLLFFFFFIFNYLIFCCDSRFILLNTN
jgi:stress-induced morphogen